MATCLDQLKTMHGSTLEGFMIGGPPGGEVLWEVRATIPDLEGMPVHVVGRGFTKEAAACEAVELIRQMTGEA
jgi:hypothetical protein